MAEQLDPNMRVTVWDMLPDDDGEPLPFQVAADRADELISLWPRRYALSLPDELPPELYAEASI
jgi:hypothetical protein